MSDTSAEAAPPKSSRTGGIVSTVLLTLACVFFFEKLVTMVPTSDYQARIKRSEALLASQEQRSKGYQEYYDSVKKDHGRFEALLGRQEEQNKRFEKVLETWERQQKEYQAYLDSLKATHE